MEQFVGMTDRALARLFLSENDNFRLVYDASDNGHIAAWMGNRWAITPSRRLLEDALFLWCEEVYINNTPAPAPDAKTDPYKRLHQTDHLAGLSRAVQALMLKVRLAQFDRDDYLLAVDGGQTVDLRTGEIRESRREDYLSKRIYFTPTDTPTPRFDRFMDEITCGRMVLKEFLLRLMALFLTGKAEQILVFFYGSGANGKGVLVRLIEKLLGAYSYTLRPEELSDGRYNDDQMKRTFALLEGARVAVVNEMRGDNMNLGMLKTLSGGDTINGAKMGRDARPIRPTWKMLFTTNQLPEVPNKSAFITRVKLVPFSAVFERNGIAGAALEAELEAELPGILWKLVKLCPDVLANGLQAPAEVEAATRDLFEEVDYVSRFRDEKLAGGGYVTRVELVEATEDWTRRNGLAKSVAKEIREQLKHTAGVTYHDRKRIDGGEPRALYEGISLVAEPVAIVGAKLSN